MPLNNKSLHELTESDFQNLIDNQVAENKTIDYKRELPGDKENDRKEFLFDITSFANTTGGHIIFGMDEDNGVPTKITPLPASSDLDAAKLRLEDIMRNGIEPRLTGVTIEIVRVTTGNLLIIHVPRSWAAPHVVKLGGTFRFYGRNSAGKYPLDVTELRNAFLAANGATENARSFRIDRVARVMSGEIPIPIPKGAKSILHLIPLDAFRTGATYDISGLLGYTNNNSSMMQLRGKASLSNQRFNFDGALAYFPNNTHYLQVFRNGIIEFVEGGHRISHISSEGHLSFLGTHREHTLLDLIPYMFKIYTQLGVEPPVFIMLTYIDVFQHTMAVNQSQYFADNVNLIDQNELLLPEVLVEDFRVDLGRAMKPIFDTVWNAGGWDRCPNYDTDGNWKG